MVTVPHLYEQLIKLNRFAKSHPKMRFLCVKLGANREEGGHSYLGTRVVAYLFKRLHARHTLAENLVLPEIYDPR